MPKFGSFFSGGGLVDVGVKMAGYDLTFANEIDPAIAAVYRANLGDHIIVGDILNLDVSKLPYVDLFHGSPVCKNASIANTNRGEKELDILTALKMCEYIRFHLPATVTVENVSQYRDFEAYRLIIKTLDECGYWHTADILNSADFGVPQTRRRLVVRAVRGGWVPYLPEPVRWVGWYEAIEDLIPTLPESEFAPWQLARLPEEIKSYLFAQNGYDGTLALADDTEPSNTITANRNQGSMRAFMLNENRTSTDWISANDVIYQQTPSPTIAANGHTARAFVIDGQESSTASGLQIVAQNSPHQTVTASQTRHPSRAWMDDGRVVKMTPRALARFQSVPDWYELPENKALAVKIIGNGVPCLMYQRIAESFLPR